MDGTLRVLHINEDHSNKNPGVTRALNLVAGLMAARLSGDSCVHIFTTGDVDIAPPPGVSLTSRPISRIGRPWCWAHDLAPRLKDLILAKSIDVVHLHGVWMAPQWLAARVAYRLGVPFMLTAHGMLDPWRLNEQGIRRQVKKKAYWDLLAYRAFRHASVIHAITPQESEHVRALFPAHRIELIPNAIDLSEVDARHGDKLRGPERMILFLGRVHPMKGVDIVIKAFAEAKLNSAWQLVIAGPAQDQEYLSALKGIVGSLGLTEQVEFIGPVFGNKKYDWLQRAWIVVYPSHSEVVGLVNLEAAACRTPTITTYNTGLWDWSEGGGLLVRPNAIELGQALCEACSWSDLERLERGQASRRLVEQRYALDGIGQRWVDLYWELAQFRRGHAVTAPIPFTSNHRSAD